MNIDLIEATVSELSMVEGSDILENAAALASDALLLLLDLKFPVQPQESRFDC